MPRLNFHCWENTTAIVWPKLHTAQNQVLQTSITALQKYMQIKSDLKKLMWSKYTSKYKTKCIIVWIT